MDPLETTNGMLADIIPKVNQLIAWAEADRDSSYESGAYAQGRQDRARIAKLTKARELLAQCER